MRQEEAGVDASRREAPNDISRIVDADCNRQAGGRKVDGRERTALVDKAVCSVLVVEATHDHTESGHVERPCQRGSWHIQIGEICDLRPCAGRKGRWDY